jgi:hypothetical protein
MIPLQARNLSSIVCLLFTAPLFVACLLVPRTSAADAGQLTKHVDWAEDLVDHVAPELNEYGSNPVQVSWAGTGGAIEYRNRSMCSSFVTSVLKQAYSLSDAQMLAWFGGKNPISAKYHDTIAAEKDFEMIPAAAGVDAGDILAIEYQEGGTSSGHTAIVAGPAVLRMTATAPFVPNTTQYEVPVLDSSQSGHGPNDTRRNPDGSWHTGAGLGTMRLYADDDGLIVGYTWSTYSVSVYYPQSERNLVVGRIRCSQASSLPFCAASGTQ